jgi:CTP:molybdopterin cytidylyltransferase MocA
MGAIRKFLEAARTTEHAVEKVHRGVQAKPLAPDRPLLQQYYTHHGVAGHAARSVCLQMCAALRLTIENEGGENIAEPFESKVVRATE